MSNRLPFVNDLKPLFYDSRHIGLLTVSGLITVGLVTSAYMLDMPGLVAGASLIPPITLLLSLLYLKTMRDHPRYKSMLKARYGPKFALFHDIETLRRVSGLTEDALVCYVQILALRLAICQRLNPAESQTLTGVVHHTQPLHYENTQTLTKQILTLERHFVELQVSEAHLTHFLRFNNPKQLQNEIANQQAALNQTTLNPALQELAHIRLQSLSQRLSYAEKAIEYQHLLATQRQIILDTFNQIYQYVLHIEVRHADFADVTELLTSLNQSLNEYQAFLEALNQIQEKKH